MPRLIEWGEARFKKKPVKDIHTTKTRESTEVLQELIEKIFIPFSNETERTQIAKCWQIYPEAISHFSTAKNLYRKIREGEEEIERKDKAMEIKLYEWQQKACQLLMDQDDRDILFVVDTLGSSGKSTLITVLEQRYPGRFVRQNMDSSTANNLFMVAKHEKISAIGFDCCRAGKFNLEVLEQTKNGFVQVKLFLIRFNNNFFSLEREIPRQ